MSEYERWINDDEIESFTHNWVAKIPGLCNQGD